MDTSKLNEAPQGKASVPSLARNPLVIIVAVVVLIVLGLAVVGWLSGAAARNERKQLEILAGLERATTTPEEQARILSGLERATSTPESQLEVLKNLKNN